MQPIRLSQCKSQPTTIHWLIEFLEKDRGPQTKGY